MKKMLAFKAKSKEVLYEGPVPVFKIRVYLLQYSEDKFGFQVESTNIKDEFDSNIVTKTFKEYEIKSFLAYVMQLHDKYKLDYFLNDRVIKHSLEQALVYNQKNYGLHLLVIAGAVWAAVAYFNAQLPGILGGVALGYLFTTMGFCEVYRSALNAHRREILNLSTFLRAD